MSSKKQAEIQIKRISIDSIVAKTILEQEKDLEDKNIMLTSGKK